MATTAIPQQSPPTPTRAVPMQMVRFGLVGLSGIAVNQVVFAGTVEWLGWAYLLGAVLATQGSSIWNFTWTELWVFSDRREGRSLFRRFATFMVVNNLTLLLRLPALWLLVEALGLVATWANLVTLVALFLLRFVVARNLIWATPLARVALDPAGAVAALDEVDPGADPAGLPPIVAVGTDRAAPYRYDIAGILKIASEVPLRELGFFRTTDPLVPDLRIVISRTGSMPSRRSHFAVDGDRLAYTEQLGAVGANFRIQMGSPITISANRLLAQSPHVLYTNVVEALLRFLLVSRGYALLHSASFAASGEAILLSAQTDTGKTSTVIRLIRERGYRFLSDDMTILTPDGRAISYPKPMTLSYHTMSAIAGQEVPRRKRATLAIQSRLHSKQGRTIGRSLGDMNIPIMSLNSVVQMVVPPPKYNIDSLFACDVGGEAPINQVFLLERGESSREELTLDDALDTLIENTDDAYGFPPFATFAPHVRIGDDDYPSLRRKERAIIARSLTAARIWRVRVPGHEWAEVLPGLIESRFRDAEPVAVPIDVSGPGDLPFGEPIGATREVG